MKRILYWLAVLMLLVGCSAQRGTATIPPENSAVVIAILDTGISSTAIDRERLLEGYNYVTNSEDTEDRINHGTAAASIIVGCESAGITGLAPEVLLLPLVVTDKVDGKVTGVTPKVLAQAIYDAVNIYGADIINVSLGIKKDVDAVRKAVEYAHKKGVLIISAVGNDGEDGAFYYPAAYDIVLGVGSHNEDGEVSEFSHQNGSADLLAPGEDIWMASRNGAVYGAKGTSYAAACVSAAAALLLTENPKMAPEQVQQALYTNAMDIGSPGWDMQSGWGILKLTAPQLQ